MKILINERYGWYKAEFEGSVVYFKGFFRLDNEVYKAESAARKVLYLFGDVKTGSYKEDILVQKLLKLRGHFSFILKNENSCLAVTDRIKSYPVFYLYRGDGFAIGNDARLIQKENNLFEKDENSFLEFEMAGYTTGSRTLFKDLKQLQAGEYIYFNQNASKLYRARYYLFWSDELSDKSEDELIEELDYVTTATFKEMIETLEGRHVWVPLSGGLDSRLVICMLRYLKYDNLACFSYGLPGNWESKAGKKIAEHLGLKWYFIPYTRGKCLRLFDTKERKDYFRFADGFCSLPYSQDFYAIWELKEKGIISEDSIVINGNSGDFISGGHIPEIFAGRENLSLNDFSSAIIDKHYSLWTDLKSEENLKIIKNLIQESLPVIHNPSNTETAARLWELWEWQARQVMYVVNLQRCYDYWGLDWRLPLWSEYYMDFWREVPIHHKINQRLYRNYLERKNLYNLFKNFDTKKYYYHSIPVIFLGLLRKMLFFMSSDKWLNFENTYIRYFTDRLQSRSIYPYLKLIRDKGYKYHRSGISLYVKRYLSEIHSF